MSSEQRPSPGSALITGATAGIGAAYARRLAADGWDLILVARDAERLDSVAADLTGRHGRRVEVIPADLSTEDGCAAVERRLCAEPPVELLVNNAGHSANRSFVQSTAEVETRLLRLNVHAVMRLSLAALRPMTQRGRGAVINVSSVSGFAPIMPGSTYPASKAWVTNFSESIGQSVRPFGVRVMAVCPGYTRTEFHSRAGINTSGLPGWAWLQADDVVADSLRDLHKGKFVSVPSWRYKVAVAALRHAPRGLLQAVTRDTRGRLRRDAA
ncbi:SDR family oxidoreductase [Micromonospora sp. NPDC000207]|uniref:SDR family NAD(P)-dependent oxidoreductase n=1 Tax=Micromonospora sp. NPDC000207 TaxID=3154246 RepID=UPI003330F03E